MLCKPDQGFKGTVYVVRIKDPRDVATIHKKQDFLHVVAYVDQNEGYDYTMLKTLVEGNTNQFIFYTFTINKINRSTFTWKQCLDALALHRPIGDSCITYHDEPITFGKFAILAFDRHILHDSVGYNELVAQLNPTPPALLLQLLHLSPFSPLLVLLWKGQFTILPR